MYTRDQKAQAVRQEQAMELVAVGRRAATERLPRRSFLHAIKALGVLAALDLAAEDAASTVSRKGDAD